MRGQKNQSSRKEKSMRVLLSRCHRSLQDCGHMFVARKCRILKRGEKREGIRSVNYSDRGGGRGIFRSVCCLTEGNFFFGKKINARRPPPRKALSQTGKCFPPDAKTPGAGK